MATTITNVIPWRLSQILGTIFSKNNRLWELEQRTAQLEHYQTMQHAITQIIARSTELDKALPRIIETICESIGWEFGEVWHIDREEGCLFCVASWHVPLLTFPCFKESSFEITFMPGKGLPGRVWATQKPAWINDVVVDTNFLRAPLAESDGLHAGVGIPIRSEGGVIGVMTFFSRRVLTIDRDLLRVLDTIGSQIGLFIERKRVEQIEQVQARKVAALEERQRLARDLHDSVTQTLFSASMMAEMLPQVWDRDHEQVRPGLVELQRLTQDALAEMRTLLVELRPEVPQPTDLGAKLGHLVDSVMAHTKLHVALEVGDQDGLRPEDHLTLYRITQEALNNIVKHAGATQVWIQVCAARGRVELKIRDNGRGFKMNCLSPGHMGLGIMRERAEEIGAQFVLNSAIGKGTSLAVTR